jgi:hypothetical protein
LDLTLGLSPQKTERLTKYSKVEHNCPKNGTRLQLERKKWKTMQIKVL